MHTLTLILLMHAPVAQSSGLDNAEHARLHKQLTPPVKEGWASIPWKTSLVQACVQAARQKKPVFMVVRAGHPLGCV